MTTYDRWLAQHVPSQSGKTALITGANSGLGFEAAKVLAWRGAHVVLAVRNAAKGERAMAEIRRSVPQAHLLMLVLDLVSLATVREAAAAFMHTHDRLDILVNNAGVMAIPRRLTADGFEMHLATNHLGHFALTGLLLPLILQTPGARVVTVSSGVHVAGRIDFSDLQRERSYSTWGAYAQSKLANLLFAYELQRRLVAKGHNAISVAAHPGYAATNLQAVGPQMERSLLRAKIMLAANRVFAQSAAMGALPIIHAATSLDVRGGDYLGPDSFLGQRGLPKKVTSSKSSHDLETAARLWVNSEQLTGVTYWA
jgi:hypothetical protein